MESDAIEMILCLWHRESLSSGRCDACLLAVKHITANFTANSTSSFSSSSLLRRNQSKYNSNNCSIMNNLKFKGNFNINNNRDFKCALLDQEEQTWRGCFSYER